MKKHEVLIYMGRKLKAVLIKTDNEYYLYPKKRYDSQKLIKLDEIGVLFWNIYIKHEEKDMVNEICKIYQIKDENTKNVVKKDVRMFINKIESIENNAGKGEMGNTIKSECDFSNQFKKVSDYYSKNKKPFKFFIEITYNCNLKCQHCYRSESIETVSRVFIETWRLKKLIDEIEAMGAVEVIITGGEPFLHPDIYEILEYATSKNLIVTLLSNGNFITEKKVIEKLKKYDLFDVRISVYGSKAHHEEMTMVKESYDRSINALKKINEHMGIGTAAFVVTKNNYEDCDEVINTMRGSNINIAVNSMITPTAQGDTSPCALRISPDMFQNLMEKYSLPITGTRCTAGVS